MGDGKWAIIVKIDDFPLMVDSDFNFPRDLSDEF